MVLFKSFAWSNLIINLAHLNDKLPSWHAFWGSACAHLYFNDIRTLFPENLPAQGAVLYLGLHRNGAVDAFVYHTVLPKASFVVASQLRRSLLARLFFTGIEITRPQDSKERVNNLPVLEQCAAYLQSGKELFIFPEGTSHLGPRHLPFHSGAARIILDVLRSQHPLSVVPVGIHYVYPWGFRSEVEVVIGSPITTNLSSELSSGEQLNGLKKCIETALEGVGVNVESEAYQHKAETMARLVNWWSGYPYYEALKVLEHTVPAPIEKTWQKLSRLLPKKGVHLYQEIPLFPRKNLFSDLFPLLLWLPVLCIAGLTNSVPLLIARWAGRQFPDANNVISLWRILVGIPVWIMWLLGITALCFWTKEIAPWLVYTGITYFGLLHCNTTLQRLVSVRNGLRYPHLIAPFQSLCQELCHHVIIESQNRKLAMPIVDKDDTESSVQ